MPALDMHRFFLRLALSGAHIFAWIFIFQYFFSRSGSHIDAVGGTVLTYALTQLIVVLLTPWAARQTRNGVRRGLTLALFCAGSAFLLLGASLSGLVPQLSYGVAGFAILMGAYRALYWTPYSISGSARESLPIEILVALMPALGGLMLAVDSLAALIIPFAASALCLLAIIPTRFMPNMHEQFAWNYRQTFRELFSDARKRTTLHAFFDGIEGAALLLLWPLAVFIVLQWSYLLFGAVMAITILSTLVLKSIRARYLGEIHSPHVHAMLVTSAWFVRAVAAGPFMIVLADTYQAGSRPHARGVEEATAEQAADNKTYVDEHTALKEMAQALGRLTLCLIAVVLLTLGSIPLMLLVCFGLAALAAVASIYTTRRTPREAF